MADDSTRRGADYLAQAAVLRLSGEELLRYMGLVNPAVYFMSGPAEGTHREKAPTVAMVVMSGDDEDAAILDRACDAIAQQQTARLAQKGRG